MNLWASWCPPCRAEMPDLQRLQTAYARDGIAIVGVNEGESPQRARAFADSLGIRFPIWIDVGQQYGRTYAALGLADDRSSSIGEEWSCGVTTAPLPSRKWSQARRAAGARYVERTAT